MMMKNPEEVVREWMKIGAARVIVHLEDLDVERIEILSSELRLETEVGLALNLDTPIEKLEEHIHHFDFIHLMSIDERGAQGRMFDEKIFDKLKELQAKHLEIPISIDGGVNLQNAEELIHLGADRLVVGSAIFGAENPEEALEDFLEIAT